MVSSSCINPIWSTTRHALKLGNFFSPAVGRSDGPTYRALSYLPSQPQEAESQAPEAAAGPTPTASHDEVAEEVEELFWPSIEQYLQNRTGPGPLVVCTFCTHQLVVEGLQLRTCLGQPRAHAAARLQPRCWGELHARVGATLTTSRTTSMMPSMQAQGACRALASCRRSCKRSCSVVI